MQMLVKPVSAQHIISGMQGNIIMQKYRTEMILYLMLIISNE